MKNVVAVTESIQQAGAIVMWTLHGPTKVEQLATAWNAEGLDPKLLPEVPTGATVLRRAVQVLRDRDRIVHPTKGGFLVVGVRPAAVEGGDEEFDVLARVRLRYDAGDARSGVLDVHTHDANLRNEVFAAWQQHEGVLATQDVSAWLASLVPSLDGVSLRSTGGVYFIPATQLEQLDRVVKAVRADTTHEIYRIPALAGDEAVRAILDSLSTEATEAVDAMFEDVSKGDLGDRARENRLARTDALEQKVARYTELLGVSMEGLTERLEQLRGALTVGMLATPAADKAA